MNVWVCRPAKPEQANRNAKAADKCWREPFLGFDFAVLVELRLGVAMKIPEEGRNEIQEDSIILGPSLYDNKIL